MPVDLRILKVKFDPYAILKIMPSLKLGLSAKGQLISEGNFDAFKSPKK